MQVINFLAETFGNIGMFQYNKGFQCYGTLLDGDYCLNWWLDAKANKIEMHLFTPLPEYELNYNQKQNLLVERFKKSKLVENVVRIGVNRIDVYLK